MKLYVTPLCYKLTCVKFNEISEQSKEEKSNTIFLFLLIFSPTFHIFFVPNKKFVICKLYLTFGGHDGVSRGGLVLKFHVPETLIPVSCCLGVVLAYIYCPMMRNGYEQIPRKKENFKRTNKFFWRRKKTIQ